LKIDSSLGIWIVEMMINKDKLLARIEPSIVSVEGDNGKNPF
jgi:hypothetical protein